MLAAFGNELKKAREQGALSLEAVAVPAKISAAYLHKLERGAVNSPSPRVLARIAAVLGLSYLRLMGLAGYLDEEQMARARRRDPQPHPLADQQLTAGEWQKVGAFISRLLAESVPG